MTRFGIDKTPSNMAGVTLMNNQVGHVVAEVMKGKDGVTVTELNSDELVTTASEYDVVTASLVQSANGAVLDIDALRVVADGVKRFHARGGKGVLLITHYTRILRYVTPDFVHVFVDGRIAEEGGPDLAEKLEAEGYVSYAGTSA